MQETIIGNFNNRDYQGVLGGSYSITIGNFNTNTKESIIIGNGVKNNSPYSVTISTFSSEFVSAPDESYISKLKIICPFGSNVSSSEPDGKLFYDAIKKKLVYNIK
jgi:hypothetical protein